jgi:tripartite-type tricarboxylate transporter receptor subunit TctC
MTAELFERDAGIRMVHVAYRGEAPAINDAVAGQIPMLFANLSAVMGHVKGGTLRGIAVTSAQRAPSAPDLPTVAETIPGFAAESWFGIVAPAGTPRDILERLNAATRKALTSAETTARLAQLGMSNNGCSPQEFDAYIKSEIARWGQVIKDGHIEAAN